MKNLFFFAIFLICSPVFADNNVEPDTPDKLRKMYESEAYKWGYEDGKSNASYAQWFGIIQGVVFGYGINANEDSFCLVGSDEEILSAIGESLKTSSTDEDNMIVFDVIPNKEQSLAFLRQHFECAHG